MSNRVNDQELPCCPCVEPQIVKTTRTVLWVVFGVNLFISLALLVPGIVLLALRNKSESNKTAGIVLTTLGCVFTIGAIVSIIPAASTSGTFSVNNRLGLCRKCPCEEPLEDL